MVDLSVKIGDITLTAINDGFARRPLEGFVRNAELTDVKKAMEQAFLPQDALNITFTTLAVQHGGKLTLIDTGNGDSGAPTSGRWMTNFKAAGFDPKDVSTVVFSHFHGDHINGFRLKDGTAVFPNAEVMVPEAEWAFWMDDAKMSAAPEGMKGAFAGVRRVFGPVAKDVKQFQAGKEILPGLTAIAAPGHTPGHTVFALASGSGASLDVADITLMRNDLAGIADAIALSRATLAKIRQNLFFAFVYNVLGIPLAAAGMLSPVIAGAAMALSSVSVVSNSLLLNRWKPLNCASKA